MAPISGTGTPPAKMPPSHCGGCAFTPEAQPGSPIALRGSSRETSYRSWWPGQTWEPRLGGYLALIRLLGRRSPGPMPQLEDGVRHGFEVSRFPESWPPWGMSIPSRVAQHVPGALGCGVWPLSPFFLHIHKQKKG